MSDKLAYHHHRLVPADEWLWPDFSPAEMACKGTGRIMVDIDAMTRLQRLRTRLGKPMLITSAYRSPEHNAKVGGAKGSYHLKGVAFDVQIANHDPVEFEKAARAEGFKGFGYYPKSGFMHIDTGPARTWGDKFPPRETRFEKEREPVESVEKREKAKGGAGAVVVGTGAAIEGARQAKDLVTTGMDTVDTLSSLGPWVLAIVGLAAAAYGGWLLWQWWKERRREV